MVKENLSAMLKPRLDLCRDQNRFLLENMLVLPGRSRRRTVSGLLQGQRDRPFARSMRVRILACLEDERILQDIRCRRREMPHTLLRN